MDLHQFLFVLCINSISCIMLILLFRKKDQSQFQLSKIKKFTDSLVAQLSDILQTKEDQVSKKALQLDDTIKKSEMWTDYLKEQLDTVEQRVNDLQSQDGIIHIMQEQVNTFYKLGKEISHNLEVLQNENYKIKDMAHQVDKVHDSISKLSKDITDTETELLTNSKHEIHSFKDQIYQALERKSLEFSEECERERRETSHKLHDLTQQQQIKLTDFRQELEQYMQESQGLKADIEKSRTQVAEQIELQYKTITSKMDSNNTKHTHYLEDLHKSMNEVEKSFKHSTEKYTEHLHDRINEASQFMNGISGTIQSLEKTLTQDLEKRMQVLTSNMHTTLTSTMNAIQASVGDKENHINDKLNTLSTQVQAFYTALKDRLNGEFQQLSVNADEEYTKIQKQSKNITLYLESFIDEEKERVKNHFQGASKQLHEDVQTLQFVLDQMKQTQEHIKSDIEESIKKNKEHFEGTYAKLQSRLLSNFENLQSEIEKEQKKVLHTYEELKNDIHYTQRNAKEQIIGEVEVLSSNIDTQKSVLHTFIETTHKDIQTKQRDLEQALTGIKDMYRGKLEGVLTSIRTDYDKTIQEYTQQSERSLKSTESKVENLNKDLRVLEESILKISKSSLDEIEKHLDHYKKDFLALIEKADQQNYEQEARITERLEDTSTQLNNKVMQIEAEVFDIRDKAIKEMGHQATQIQSSVRSMEQEYNEVLESKASEYNKRLNDMTHYMNTMKLSTQKESEKFLYTMRDRIEKLGRELEGKLLGKVDKSTLDLKTNLDQLEADLGNRVKVQIEHTQLQLSNLNQEINRIKNYDFAIDEFNKRFNENIEQLGESLKQVRKELENEAKEDFQKITKELKFIDERIESFIRESKIFKKADRFYESLRAEIQNAQEHIKELKNEKAQIEGMEGVFKRIEQEQRALQKLLQSIENEKTELKYVTQKSEELRGVYTDITKQIEKLNEELELVNKVELKLNALEGMYTQTEEKMKTLNTTQANISKSIEFVQNTEGFLQKLPEQLEVMKKEHELFHNRNKKMKEECGLLEKRFALLSGSEEKMKEFSEKFEQIDSLTTDIEKRIKQLEIMQKRLKEKEIHFEHIQNNADTRITKLSSLLEHSEAILTEHTPNQTNGAHGGVATLPQTSVNGNRHQAVIKLHNQGFDIDRISTLLNLSKSEVKLIMDMHKTKNP